MWKQEKSKDAIYFWRNILRWYSSGRKEYRTMSSIWKAAYESALRDSMTGVSGNDFWGFGNGKGIEKAHSRNSGTGRELKKPIPEIREREGNGKNPFPKFGNGKGMKKIHSRNSGTGREWKNPFPKFGKGNQRPPFLGMTGNGNGNNILFTFLDFFLPGSTLKIFSLTLCPKIFSWLPHMYSDSQKKFGTKTQCKIFHDGTLRGGHLNSEKPVGFCYPACMGLPWNI